MTGLYVAFTALEIPFDSSSTTKDFQKTSGRGCAVCTYRSAQYM